MTDSIPVPSPHPQPPPHRRRRSHRRVRTRVFVEGPDGGVTEKAANVAAEGEREVWVQVGDAADAATREDYADALLDLHSTPRDSTDAGVGGHVHQAYADWGPGDMVALEGRDGMQVARAESITMRLGDQVDTDVTLTSRAQLQIEDLETLLERMGDASRAASPSLQKRHGLISADKIESGRIRVDQDIASSNFSAGSAGWQVRGNGSAEFNDVTIRSTLQSDNFQAGSDGWRLRRSGSAELNNVTVRGEIHASSGNISGDLTVGGSLRASYTAGSQGWRVNGDGTAEFNEITVRGTVTGSTIEASTVDSSSFRTATSGERVVMGTGFGVASNTLLFFDSGNNETGQIAAGSGGLSITPGLDGTEVFLFTGGSGQVSVLDSLGPIRDWGPIHASDFVQESDPSGKADVEAYDPGGGSVDSVAVYRFTDHRGRRRVGWMADEVPDVARREAGGSRQVSLADMVAILWAEVATLKEAA